MTTYTTSLYESQFKKRYQHSQINRPTLPVLALIPSSEGSMILENKTFTCPKRLRNNMRTFCFRYGPNYGPKSENHQATLQVTMEPRQPISFRVGTTRIFFLGTCLGNPCQVEKAHFPRRRANKRCPNWSFTSQMLQTNQRRTKVPELSK